MHAANTSLAALPGGCELNRSEAALNRTNSVDPGAFARRPPGLPAGRRVRLRIATAAPFQTQCEHPQSVRQSDKAHEVELRVSPEHIAMPSLRPDQRVSRCRR